MNSSKVHSQRTVPFSWENKPGVSKDNLHHHYTSGDRGDFPIIKLPPPPCPPEKPRASFHGDMQIPPPPCPNFQQPLKSSSRRRSFKKNNDDPFLLAYKECTKSTSKDHKGLTGVINWIDGGLGLKKNLSAFSCKHLGNFIDDSIVRVSQLPVSKSQKES